LPRPERLMGICVPNDDAPWRAQLVDRDDLLRAESFPALRAQLTKHGASEREINLHAGRLGDRQLALIYRPGPSPSRCAS
jgi:hypothetical protein